MRCLAREGGGPELGMAIVKNNRQGVSPKCGIENRPLKPTRFFFKDRAEGPEGAGMSEFATPKRFPITGKVRSTGPVQQGVRVRLAKRWSRCRKGRVSSIRLLRDHQRTPQDHDSSKKTGLRTKEACASRGWEGPGLVARRLQPVSAAGQRRWRDTNCHYGAQKGA